MVATAENIPPSLEVKLLIYDAKAHSIPQLERPKAEPIQQS